MKIVFAFLLLIHGLIHVMGYVKSRKPAKLPRFTRTVSRAAGTGWLVAAILFAMASAMLFLGMGYWWLFALPAVVLSQILIFSFWFDARFGTLLNALIVLAVVMAIGSWNFTRQARDAWEEIQTGNAAGTQTIVPDIEKLPEPVKNWIRYSGANHQPAPYGIWLSQTGAMRTSATGNWMPFYARQWDTWQSPSFLWLARVKVAPGVKLLGRDTYTNGRGHMLIKAAGLIPVADATGPATDQGAMLRYLGELVWMPFAALSDNITWEPVDSLTAKATLTVAGTRGSGIFRFSSDGRVVSFEADRYYDRSGSATLEKWQVICDPQSYQTFGNYRIPTRCEVTWKLKEGDFTWLKLNILDHRTADKALGLPPL